MGGGGGIFDTIGGIAEDVTGINLSGNSSSDRALAAQQGAARDSNAAQLQMYNQTREDQTPWREAGARALNGMESQDFQRDFTMNDFTADPGYQFRMQEGMKALQNSAAARGGLGSGATMKALMGYGQGLASEEYNNAYNRFNSDRDRRFNRLASLAGAGQTANNQIGAAGQNYATAYGNNIMGAANAQAGQAIAQANQTSNLIGQGMTAAALGGKLAFCDERLKTDIAPVDKAELLEMKKHLKAYHFKYKSSQHGVGEFVGVMAQDLEKSKLGRTLVFEDQFGNKQVDLTKAMMLLLASMAEAA